MEGEWQTREKVFRDNVHGYIRVPSVIVDKIIDTVLFQRLRNIEQTSMRPLFPSARHDRFIHSLGTYHLGCIAFDSIVRNMKGELSASFPKTMATSSGRLKRRYLFVIACLLHDCAHAPFSHTLEEYYGIVFEGDEGGVARLDRELLKEYEGDPDFKEDYEWRERTSSKPAEHERMSALMIGRYFRHAISAVFKEMWRQGALDREDAELDECDFSLMARMVLGCGYRDPENEGKAFDNCLISLLNSQSIDVDGLDYTMRDTVDSGLDNWSIDCARLLRSLGVAEAARLDGCRLKDGCFDGIVLSGATLKADGQGGNPLRSSSVSVRGSFMAFFEDEGDADRLKGDGRISRGSNHERGIEECYCEGGEHVLNNPVMPYELRAISCCRLKLCDWGGVIDGTVVRSRGYMEARVCQGSVTRSYVLTFDKSSVGVIDGAVEARNYFYKRIYSHPQVLYRSTFLQHHLLKLSARYLCCMLHNPDFRTSVVPPQACGPDCCPAVKRDCDSIFGEERVIEEILGLDGFYAPDSPIGRMSGTDLAFSRSDDSDLSQLFKWVYLDNAARSKNLRSKEIETFFGEYFSHRGMRPLWKSPEDRRHFFLAHEGLPAVSYRSLRRTNATLSTLSYAFIPSDDPSISLFEARGYKGILAISTSRRVKTIDYASTFIRFVGGIERLKDVADPPDDDLGDDMVYLFAREFPEDDASPRDWRDG